MFGIDIAAGVAYCLRLARRPFVEIQDWIAVKPTRPPTNSKNTRACREERGDSGPRSEFFGRPGP